VTGAMLAIAMTLMSPSPVGTLLLPADGKSATALCRDHKLRVFSLPDGKLLRTIDWTPGQLALSTISDDGRWVMLSDYLGDVSIWRHDFVPGLVSSLGHLWPVILLLTVVGGVLTLGSGRGRLARGLGVTVLGGLVAYVLTPASAGGPAHFPVLFGLNVRFVAPPLALGLALLPCAPALAHPRRRTPMLVALAALLLATQWSASFRPPAAAGWGALLAASLLATAFALRALARRRHALAGPALVVMLLAAVAEWPAQANYMHARYAQVGPTLPAISVWAQRLHHQRIAVSGYLLQYPLYGRDTSNTVDWIGRRGAHGAFSPVRSCAEWRSLLAARRYRWVVTVPAGSVVLAAPSHPPADPPEAGWTRSDPGARVVLREPALKATLFHLDGTPTEAGCPSATVSRSG